MHQGTVCGSHMHKRLYDKTLLQQKLGRWFKASTQDWLTCYVDQPSDQPFERVLWGLAHTLSLAQPKHLLLCICFYMASQVQRSESVQKFATLAEHMCWTQQQIHHTAAVRKNP